MEPRMSDWVPLLLVVHAAATWFMTGLIWFVQIVHYPLMSGVGPDRFREYERRHTRRTTFVVAPIMLVELASAGVLLATGVSPTLALVGAILLAVVWISTFLLQVPTHARLERGLDARTHSKLVAGNWVRCVAWSARSVVASAMLLT